MEPDCFQSIIVCVNTWDIAMKSIYQDKEFAKFWNSRVGNDGEDLKRFVLDPFMFNQIGSLNKKTILEMGCGNGYLAPRFLQQNPAKVFIVDVSEENLQFARQKTQDNRVTFLQQDITQSWNIDSNRIDIIYSNMVLNEVSVIDKPIQEAYRVLKPNGQLIFSVLHPSFFLYFYAQLQAGTDSGKFKNLGGYFSHNDCKYLMGTVSVTKPAEQVEVTQNFEVEQTQKTISDYFNQLISAGFLVKGLFEPELSEEMLEYNHGFKKYTDRPMSLVFHAFK
jgi:ubiquinone/menaquinone biosynthesis C-methylase UbiE